MDVFLLKGQIPELKSLAPDQRKAAYRACSMRLLEDQPRSRWVMALVAGIAAAIASECSWRLLRAPDAPGEILIPEFWLREMAGPILTGTVMALLLAPMTLASIARFNSKLRPYLKEYIQRNQ
jgi:hypothetical protein